MSGVTTVGNAASPNICKKVGRVQSGVQVVGPCWAILSHTFRYGKIVCDVAHSPTVYRVSNVCDGPVGRVPSKLLRETPLLAR